ncbi:MAG: hypothetical protein GY771_00790 [bacterium]|nr:hypothetical protein [bacterium]
MRYLLILTVIFATVAYGAMDFELGDNPNYTGMSTRVIDNSSKDVIVDNLCSSEGDVVNGYSLYFGNNWWCAIDWVVSGNDWTFGHWTFDLIPLGGYGVDLYIEIYEGDLDSPPIDSMTIPAGDVTWAPAGYNAFGYTVQRGDCDVNPTTDPFLNGTTYWIALSMGLSDNGFWVVTDIIIDDYIYFYDGSAWYSSVEMFDEESEGSYMIEGTPYPDTVEGASLGTLKAAFK